MRNIFLFFIIFLRLALYGQNSKEMFNIELIDVTGAPIAYASVSVGGGQMYLTNEDGKCGFIHQTDNVQVKLSISHVAYESIDTILQPSTFIHQIILNSRTLETVEVVTSRLNRVTSLDGATQLSRGFVDLIPSMTGSSNFTMAIKTLPGVQTSYDFSSGYVVRGGDLDQNQVLIDNVYLYNLNHIGGIFPVVNNEILKSVNFYSGPIPSHLGGRLSSYTVLETRTPNALERKTKIRVGLLDADVTLDIPIVKNKLSLFTSNRFVHFMPLLLASDILYRTKAVSSSVNLGFYDTYNKMVYQVNDRLNFKALFYKNKDYFQFKENGNDLSETKDRNSWGNTAFNLTSNYLISKRMSIRNSFYFTRYSRLGESVQIKKLKEQQDSIIDFSSTSGYINDYTLQSNIEYVVPKGKIVAGINWLNREIVPSKFYSKNSINTNLLFEVLRLREYGFFTHIYQNFNTKFRMDWGLRVNLAKGSNFQYLNYEPRINFIYNISEQLSANLAYSKTVQSVFQAGGGLTGINDEYWFQVNDKIKPQIAHIYSLAFDYTFSKFNMKSGLFYKKMDKLIDAQIGILPSFYVSHDEVLNSISKDVKGYAYGIEYALTGQWNKIFTTLSYTYARSLRTHPEIFDGKPFPSIFDRPHVLNFVNQYKFNSKWSISTSFLFQSGMRYSRPIGYFHDLANVPVPIYYERNNAQLIPYHRLDIGASRNWVSKRGNKKQLWLSVINTYNRKNASYIFPEYDQDKLSLRKVTLLPIFPTIAYSVEF